MFEQGLVGTEGEETENIGTTNNGWNMRDPTITNRSLLNNIKKKKKIKYFKNYMAFHCYYIL